MQQRLTNVNEFGIYDLIHILPIGDEQIRRYLQQGRLKGVKKRGKWRVSKDNLVKFIDELGFESQLKVQIG